VSAVRAEAWLQVVARRLGRELVKRKRHPTLDVHLSLLFESLDVNCVLDVGANRGQFGEGLRAGGYTGWIVSFEPVNSVFQRLQQRAAADDHWRAWDFGLGRENTQQPIHVAEDATLSSFLAPNAYGQRRFERAQVVAQESVEVRRLDDVFDEVMPFIADPRIFLKLDTQGYDLEVVAGARRVLERVVGLQSELSVISIYDGMPDYLTALKHFHELGFEVTGLYPVTRDRESLVVIELDCVMRRTS
jgi:FkbM family methyltransferase